MTPRISPWKLMSYSAAICLLLLSACGTKEIHPWRFRPEIPAANEEAYAQVHTAEDWENPYLIVRPGGVEIRGVADLIDSDALPSALATIPLDAWPYGRIVAVQEVGIVSGSDEQTIAKELAYVLDTLAFLQIAVSLKPH